MALGKGRSGGISSTRKVQVAIRRATCRQMGVTVAQFDEFETFVMEAYRDHLIKLDDVEGIFSVWLSNHCYPGGIEEIRVKLIARAASNA